jgi:hypothetical protein
MSIPIFSAWLGIHSRVIPLTRTWTSGQSLREGWATWIGGSGSKTHAQIVTENDEEAGNRFGIVTAGGVEQISGIDENGGLPAVARVRKDSLRTKWDLIVSPLSRPLLGFRNLGGSHPPSFGSPGLHSRDVVWEWRKRSRAARKNCQGLFSRRITHAGATLPWHHQAMVWARVRSTK